ncbi:MAG: adenosylcobinamide-GDP ribazoletransferase [Firmicutes bacterium]|nr:adenosylcobinamide-GDP ribazoletransferase [Bacillota bacterium]
MKKLFTGFCMSWGMFCYIPGPKRWDEEARPYMLAWLPTVGAIIGIIWAALMAGLNYISFPAMAFGAVATWLPFVLSGFMHVDGYMDVNDAVMSRGTLEKKRAILKDSRCGTFAIVSFIFLVLVEFGVLSSAASYLESLDALVRAAIIMTVPRAFSGLMMMTLKPMDTSQYQEMKRDKKAEAFLLAQLIFWIVIAAIITGEGFNYLLMTVSACILGTLISIFFARHELQGMNGDIAGYGILWGELMGIISLAVYFG